MFKKIVVNFNQLLLYYKSYLGACWRSFRLSHTCFTIRSKYCLELAFSCLVTNSGWRVKSGAKYSKYSVIKTRVLKILCISQLLSKANLFSYQYMEVHCLWARPPAKTFRRSSIELHFWLCSLHLPVQEEEHLTFSQILHNP